MTVILLLLTGIAGKAWSEEELKRQFLEEHYWGADTGVPKAPIPRGLLVVASHHFAVLKAGRTYRAIGTFPLAHSAGFSLFDRTSKLGAVGHVNTNDTADIILSVQNGLAWFRTHGSSSSPEELEMGIFRRKNDLDSMKIAILLSSVAYAFRVPVVHRSTDSAGAFYMNLNDGRVFVSNVHEMARYTNSNPERQEGFGQLLDAAMRDGSQGPLILQFPR